MYMFCESMVFFLSEFRCLISKGCQFSNYKLNNSEVTNTHTKRSVPVFHYIIILFANIILLTLSFIDGELKNESLFFQLLLLSQISLFQYSYILNWLYRIFFWLGIHSGKNTNVVAHNNSNVIFVMLSADKSCKVISDWPSTRNWKQFGRILVLSLEVTLNLRKYQSLVKFFAFLELKELQLLKKCSTKID